MFKLKILLLTLVFMVVSAPAFAANPIMYKDWQDIPSWAYTGDIKYSNHIYGEFPDAVKYELYIGYPDNTLRPNADITRAEFAQAVANVLDVFGKPGNQWYAKAVNGLIDKGIIPSWDGDWNAPISRQEMGQWVGKTVAAYGIPRTKNISFSDTKDPDILNAARAGLIVGYPDGSFGINDTAPRCQAAIMMVRLARSIDEDAPTAEEMIPIDKAVTEKGIEIAKKAYETDGQWDYSIGEGYVSRKVSEAARIVAASGGYRMPLPTRFSELKILEAHKSICKVETVYESQDPGKTEWWKGPTCTSYYRNIDGKWVNTANE